MMSRYTAKDGTTVELIDEIDGDPFITLKITAKLSAWEETRGLLGNTPHASASESLWDMLDDYLNYRDR